MKIKLDPNLSQHLRDDLTALKHDVDSVVEEGLSGASDTEVPKAATALREMLLKIVSLLSLSLDPARYRSRFRNNAGPR